MPYLPYVERVAELYEGRTDCFDPAAALAEFQKATGPYKDTDPWYEERSRLFFDHLVLRHPSPPYRSIVHRCFVEHLPRLRAEGTTDIYRGLLATHASVFAIAAVRRETVLLQDLVGGGTFRAWLPEGAYGFARNVFVSATLIPLRERIVLGRGILLHPETAGPLIRTLVADLKKEGILSWQTPALLMRMKLQYDMSPTFKLSSIYSSKSFLVKR